jgi:hypothetical protein
LFQKADRIAGLRHKHAIMGLAGLGILCRRLQHQQLILVRQALKHRQAQGLAHLAAMTGGVERPKTGEII